MDHSYEEIRQAAIEILRGTQGANVNQYENLKNAVAHRFDESEGASSRAYVGFSNERSSLSRHDANLLLEVFWGLFREGIITLGVDDHNREFPWFRLSEFGRKIVHNQEPYFFHDVSTYESRVRLQVPEIDDVTMIYLKEALQSFKSSCLLSSSVMLGVAAEHTFMKLLETIQSTGTHYEIFRNVYSEKMMLRKLNKFKNILDQNQGILPSYVREDLDTNFAGITMVIRNFRNESGHPTGKIIDREQCFVLLQLFIPYCRKMYDLTDALK